MADYTLYNVKVTTLTPLHIGNGEELLADYDYTVQDGQTWRIDEAALLDAQNVADPAIADRLARTPPAQLLKRPGDFRPGSPFFRYTFKGVPRSQAEGAQLREQLKDIYDRPYLPGSSLKGALRTAVAWYAWQGQDVKPEVGRLDRRREWAAQAYERQLLGRDPNHDLLRAVQVSDSRPVAPDRLMLVNARVIGRGGKLAAPIELEAIRRNTVFETTLKLDHVYFSAWAQRHGLTMPGGEWLSRLPEVVRAHVGQRVTRELAWFAEIPGTQRVLEFYKELEQARLKGGRFAIQAGWGTGWDSKTFGSRLQANADFMENIIDNYRLARGARQRKDPFPKSRRVAVTFAQDGTGARVETPVLPLGWVLVEMEPRP